MLDFQEGVPIKIEGELGQYNTLPLDVLIEIGRNLQELIKNLAISNILDEAEAIHLGNFNIELSDFRKASAVPVFVWSPRPVTGNLTADVSKQKAKVNASFSELMEFSNANEYGKIAERYPLPILRNKIVESLNGLTNSFGNSPAFIATNSKEKPEPIYAIRKMPPVVREKLLTTITDDRPEKREELVFGKFLKTSQGNKKPKLRPIDVFTDQSVSLAYAPEIIETNGKKYHLNFPLRCLLEKEDDFFIVKSEQLDIIGTGETEAEAKQSFGQEFDFVFSRYNQLGDEKLSPRLRGIKTMLNLFVKNIE